MIPVKVPPSVMFSRTLLLCALCLLAACDQAPGTAASAVSLTLALPCDIHSGCTARNNELVMNVRFGTIPRALQPFPMQVSIESDKTVESVTVGFSMRGMDMGHNRYRLVAAASHDWKGNVTLPICSAGRSDWLADIEVMVAGKRYRLALPFVLEK